MLPTVNSCRNTRKRHMSQLPWFIILCQVQRCSVTAGKLFGSDTLRSYCVNDIWKTRADYHWNWEMWNNWYTGRLATNRGNRSQWSRVKSFAHRFSNFVTSNYAIHILLTHISYYSTVQLSFWGSNSGVFCRKYCHKAREKWTQLKYNVHHQNVLDLKYNYVSVCIY